MSSEAVPDPAAGEPVTGGDGRSGDEAGQPAAPPEAGDVVEAAGTRPGTGVADAAADGPADGPGTEPVDDAADPQAAAAPTVDLTETVVAHGASGPYMIENAAGERTPLGSHRPEDLDPDPEPGPHEQEAVPAWGWFTAGGVDVAQAVCVDRDVRRINLSALRPVAAAHPFPLLFSSVSGAHLYGFPSRSSDVDLRGVHLLPAVQVVGLRHGPQTVERTWLHDEVRLDLVTHDLGKFLRLLLRRNGTVLENLLSPLVVSSGPVHEELVALAPGCLTRQHAQHYRAAAQAEWDVFGQAGELRPLLYTFRLLLTGIHVTRTGQLITHLPTLLETVPDAPGYLTDLIELRSEGDEVLAKDVPDVVVDDVARLQAELDQAEEESPLPDHAGAEGALHDLLVRVRLEGPAAWPV